MLSAMDPLALSAVHMERSTTASAKSLLYENRHLIRSKQSKAREEQARTGHCPGTVG
jgi:hypothetical protein